MQLSVYRIVEGRRPIGLVPLETTSNESVLGDYFAHAAYLEAASALAYARLGRELELHGAPNRLVDACSDARVSEVRHARSLGHLATRHGTTPTTPLRRKVRVRSLVDIALINIVEGFVRTTYGAATAQVRARSASDERVRAVMEEISRDEQVHAQLAFDVAVWVQSEIDPVDAVLVEDTMRHAVVALARELDAEVAPELHAVAGVPSRREALAIWSRLSRDVWHGVSARVWDAAICRAA